MNHEELKECFNGDAGTFFIKDTYLPHTYFDPLGKIWAAAKKEAHKKYKLDIAGIFVYENIKGIISCTFQLSYAHVEETPEAIRNHASLFEKHFPEIARDFRETVDCFLEDDAYEEYLALAQKKRSGLEVSRGEFDRIFNLFLKDLGLK